MESPFRVGVTVNPRRLSVNDSFHDVENNIRKAVARLNELWDQVHMPEMSRVSRVTTAFKHISKLLTDMVASEEDMVLAVAKDIQDGLPKINKLRSQLGLEPWQNKSAPPGSIQLELLPEEQVRVLVARRLHLEDMLQKRVRQANIWKKDMEKFLTKVGKSLLKEDINIRTVVEVDFEKDDICLSEAMMNTIEEYHQQLNDLYTEYVQENDFRWLELYAKLSELWKSCHVADVERVIPSSYDPDKHTEKDFINMSTEISRLESLYAARKDVFDVLTKWKDTWANKIALEEKRKTADYYQNRGRENNVFLDAKMERTLNEHTLPKLMKTLIAVYDEYRRAHPDDDFRVDGFTPPDYVKWVLDEYNAGKEVERKNRQMQRMASSSSLRTPQSSQRRLPPRAVSSSKLGLVRKRLHYDSTLSQCFDSTAASIPSVITPTKRIKVV
uniref:Protein regulator of cytokinesis 1 n=1 Tax=Angiostrongylus cantonensis TaxID=6313 RepID=A0A158P6E7_ANGCA